MIPPKPNSCIIQIYGKHCLFHVYLQSAFGLCIVYNSTGANNLNNNLLVSILCYKGEIS